MNDLYKSLYIQAVNFCAEQGSEDGINHAWLWERKYAELIIRECLKQVDNPLDRYSIEEYFRMED